MSKINIQIDNFSTYFHFKLSGMDILEKLYRNPGLLHVAEHVVEFMDNSTVAQCRLVNKESNEFLAKIWLARVKEEAQKLCEIKFEALVAEYESDGDDRFEETSINSIFELWPDWKVALKEITSCEDMCSVTYFLHQYISRRLKSRPLPYIASPIHFAARNPTGHWSNIIEILISTSLNFKRHDIFHSFPNVLHTACHDGHEDTVKILMKNASKKGIDINALVPELNWSIVHSAMKNKIRKPGNPVLKCLFDLRKEFDFDFSQPLVFGTPILHFSIGSTRLETFEIMVQWAHEIGHSLSAVNQRGENILHRACESAPKKALLMLELSNKSKFGFDRNLLASLLGATNNFGERPIDKAKNNRLPKKRRKTLIQELEKIH